MEKQKQFLSFELNSQLYGVPIGLVREINQISETTPVPKTPDYIVGVMNLRGKVIPVIDMRLKLGMPKAKATKETCVIVFEVKSGLVGAVVDKVQSVVDFTEEQIEAPPDLGGEAEAYLLGMGNLQTSVAILLDLIKLFERDGVVGDLARKQVEAA